MNKKLAASIRTASAVAMFACGAAHALDWNGYLRAGPGEKGSTGDRQSCFSAQGGDNTFGHGGVGRLGNECETYGEFTLSQGGKAGGIDFKTILMTNFYRPGSDIGAEKLGVNQAWVQASGFDFAPDVSFWAGKRFGNRAFVYFDDYFPINMTGTGAGVDGIKIGDAALGLAVFRDGDDTPNPGTRLNADLGGINTNPGGKLRITGVATSFSGPGGSSGAGLSLQHDQAGVLGGVNTLWLQYAKGSAEANMNFAPGNSTSDRKAWRIVESMLWGKGPLTGQLMLRYGQYGPDNARVDFSSIGGRVAYAFTRNFKLQAELGTGVNKPEGGASQRLTKFTVAPTLTTGPDWLDRPELRLYVSRFDWNGAYAAANAQKRTSKTAAGVQVEIWF
ncbi:carbohydrate porin [Azohydromonas australica]|uniref:carbohydrate porin n=1 Tax=Azohydromonas australica TaxID=364039 RepID=UPI0004148214|nr:carbohydrate porin [Azohydromonas australica]